MTMYNDVTYGVEDCAKVAELLLAAGRAHEIPARLRSGILPEFLERELMAAPPVAAPRAAAPARRATIDQELEAAAQARFAAQRAGLYR